jgi:chromosome segregation ATPase
LSSNDLESQKEPQKKELSEVNERIAELKDQLEHYLDLVGQKGEEVVTELFTKRLEKLDHQIKGLERKKGDLTLMLASSPSEINAKYVLEAVKGFSGVYDELSNQDKAIYLGLIVQDVTVFDDRISVRIHTLPENPSDLTGSKNRLAWLRD